MTKHQATAVIILREQVTGEWRPDSRGQGVEAKAKARPCRGQGRGHDFLSSRCPGGRGQSLRAPSLVNIGVGIHIIIAPLYLRTPWCYINLYYYYSYYYLLFALCFVTDSAQVSSQLPSSSS